MITSVNTENVLTRLPRKHDKLRDKLSVVRGPTLAP